MGVPAADMAACLLVGCHRCGDVASILLRPRVICPTDRTSRSDRFCACRCRSASLSTSHPTSPNGSASCRPSLDQYRRRDAADRACRSREFSAPRPDHALKLSEACNQVIGHMAVPSGTILPSRPNGRRRPNRRRPGASSPHSGNPGKDTSMKDPDERISRRPNVFGVTCVCAQRLSDAGHGRVDATLCDPTANPSRGAGGGSLPPRPRVSG